MPKEGGTPAYPTGSLPPLRRVLRHSTPSHFFPSRPFPPSLPFPLSPFLFSLLSRRRRLRPQPLSRFSVSRAGGDEKGAPRYCFPVAIRFAARARARARATLMNSVSRSFYGDRRKRITLPRGRTATPYIYITGGRNSLTRISAKRRQRLRCARERTSERGRERGRETERDRERQREERRNNTSRSARLVIVKNATFIRRALSRAHFTLYNFLEGKHRF